MPPSSVSVSLFKSWDDSSLSKLLTDQAYYLNIIYTVNVTVPIPSTKLHASAPAVSFVMRVFA